MSAPANIDLLIKARWIVPIILTVNLLAPPSGLTDELPFIQRLQLPAQQERFSAHPHMTDPVAALGINQLRNRIVERLNIQSTQLDRRDIRCFTHFQTADCVV